MDVQAGYGLDVPYRHAEHACGPHVLPAPRPMGQLTDVMYPRVARPAQREQVFGQLLSQACVVSVVDINRTVPTRETGAVVLFEGLLPKPGKRRTSLRLG